MEGLKKAKNENTKPAMAPTRIYKERNVTKPEKKVEAKPEYVDWSGKMPLSSLTFDWDDPDSMPPRCDPD